MESTNRSTPLVQIVVVFVALLVAGIGITAGARAIAGQAEQQILMHAGSALVSGGLAFFLVEMFRRNRMR